jgi:iron complex transport system ATP-binding protein
MSPPLTFEHVTFAYGRHPALADASLTVRAGELVCIVGPNGAGKSTLVRLAAGLLSPGAGSVRVWGEAPEHVPRRRLARRVAYLPQDYQVVFPFTALEVVLMGRYPHLSPLALEGDADREAALAAMARCDVTPLAARRFQELSGGERRRVLLAQAFCQAAPLLLLDEPTAALDPAHAVAVFRLLREIARGAGDHAVVVVTHDLNLAARFADRLVVVDRARIAADAAPLDALAGAAAVFGTELHTGTLPDGAPFVVPA